MCEMYNRMEKYGFVFIINWKTISQNDGGEREEEREEEEKKKKKGEKKRKKKEKKKEAKRGENRIEFWAREMFLKFTWFFANQI